MATLDSGGSIQGTTINASTGFVGNGSLLTNLPAGQVTAGSPNSVVITDGSSKLTTETLLATTRGGTNTNSSSATGIPHVAGGTWTYSGIASADLAVGFSVTNAQTTATPNNTPSTIVSRDGSGNFTAGNITSSTETQNGTQIATVGVTTIRAANIQTVGATTTPILTFTTTNSSVFVAKVLIACNNTTDLNNNTGVIEYLVKATTNSSGVVLISVLANYTSILDANVSTAASNVNTSGNNNLTINVVGIAAKNINWLAKVTTLSQA